MTYMTILGVLFPPFLLLVGAVLLVVAPIVDHKRSVARKLAQYEDVEERYYLLF